MLYKGKDLDLISKDTGISVEKFAWALEISIDQAGDSKKAKEAALIELVSRFTTPFDQGRDKYRSIHSDSKEAKEAALIEWIETATTLYQAREEAYMSTEDNTEPERCAIKKIFELS